MGRGLVAWWLGMLAAVAMQPPPPYFENAVQDVKGVIWAYSRAEYDQVYSYDGSDWTARGAPFDAHHNAMPAYMVRMTDGAVACIWRYEDHSIAVTRHLGTESSLLGIGPGEVSESGLYVPPLADSQNRLWITGDFPKIYRTDGKGTVTLMHEIKPEEWRNPGNAHQGYNKIHAVEDGHGRVWAWSDPAAGNWASLRGVLIFTGDACELREVLPPTMKDARILAIAKADATHMWITVADDGIYKLDIDTFALERVPDPAPKALCCIHELHVEGNDIYAVEEQPRFQDELWRRRDGQWTEIIPHLDLHPNSFNTREWLPIKEGLLVTSIGGGPWFIPNQGEPAQFNWRSGFTFEDFHAMARFADGTFFGMGRSGGQIFHGPLTLPPKELQNPRIVEIEPEQGWVYGSTGRIWMIPRNPPLVLKEWDGTQWVVHEFPPGTQFAGGLNEDDEGRLWTYGKSTLLFDPGTNQWQTFPKMRDAFLAFKDKPVHFLHDQWFITPQYSADRKRVAYREGVIWVDYYDGSAWHQFTRNDILEKKGGDNAVGPPWFDDAGHLHVNMRNKMSFVMDDAGKWSAIPWVSHFPADIWSEGHEREAKPVPPEGSITAKPDSIVVDNRGTTWMTSNGVLYKCITGFCVPVFGPDEINPFRSQPQLREAYVDGQGNTFLLTAGSEMDRMMIRSKGAAPSTKITLEPKAGDCYVAHFDAHTTEQVRFRWRLDDGDWAMSDTTAVILDHLPNGPHVLQVVAADDELNMDAAPVEAKFETRIDSAKQIAQLIAQLSDPDYDQRKAAVNALAQQPGDALPALEQARATASDDQRWWIDAATQECERRAAAKKADPGSGP